jgi:hypothetical protein
MYKPPRVMPEDDSKKPVTGLPRRSAIQPKKRAGGVKLSPSSAANILKKADLILGQQE